jgi:hypothetical protein
MRNTIISWPLVKSMNNLHWHFTVETEMSVQNFSVEIFSRGPFSKPTVTHTVRYFAYL